MTPPGKPAQFFRALSKWFVFHRLKSFEILAALRAEIFVRGHELKNGRMTVEIALNKAQFKPSPCSDGPDQGPFDFARLPGTRFGRNHSMLPPVSRAALLPFLGGLALFMSACEEDVRFSSQTQYLGGIYGNAATTGAPQDAISYWDGENLGGKPSVKISLAEQRAYFYKNGLLVGVSQLSTGREGLNTPLGRFSIIQKDVNHVSSRYGDYVDDAGNVVMPNVDVEKDRKPPGTHFKGAPMPYFMRIVDGVGMHAGYLPGYPASHGCIRMPEFMAENFFKSVSTGTPVTITN